MWGDGEKQAEGHKRRGKEKTFKETDRTADRHAGEGRFRKDLPGSVGISEPSFATHLQPLTRCH